MSHYLVLESRDCLESRDSKKMATLAEELVQAGHQVTVFLIQNGVLGARSGAVDFFWGEMADRGGEVLADEFSLRERGIPAQGLHPGVEPASLDRVIDLMASGCKVIWH